MPDPAFWQQRYEAGETPWDLGKASPHFEAWLREEGAAWPRGRMAVPGAGRGHDAALFARAGFDVTGLDYAPGAVAEAKKLYGGLAAFEQADIFNLDSKWFGQFDYVLEHTCFCAISPKRRPDYKQAVLRLLKPGGRLVGVFWEHDDPDGPPYPTTMQDLKEIFPPELEAQSLVARPPAEGRSGIEYFGIFKKTV